MTERNHNPQISQLYVSPRTDRADTRNEIEEKPENNPQKTAVKTPLAGDLPISKILDSKTKEGSLYKKIDDDFIQCFACEHNCKIKNGSRGVCQVRFNLDGKLFVPWGYVAALQCDPIEKKPFFHFMPGSDALTYGMMGCDLHCAYCQNWDISQTLRDANAGRPPKEISPQDLVRMAQKLGASALVSSYNEPLITSEWSREIFSAAKKEGLLCAYVSNGNGTHEVLEFIRPYTDAYKIDLKTMRDSSYRKLGTSLENVLNGIKMVHKLGFWLEIVTLTIPGFNDSEEELKDAAQFIKSISPNIPWHITAFHKDYRMQENDETDSQTLIKAIEIGYQEGLNFVYAGNRPGRVKAYENTFCPSCKTCLVERLAYVILGYHLTDEGNCYKCGSSIPGIWPKAKDVRIGTPNDLYTRVPKAIRWN